MTVNIYINGKPIESYEPNELEKLKSALTIKAMAAIGYVLEEDK